MVMTNLIQFHHLQLLSHYGQLGDWATGAFPHTTYGPDNSANYAVVLNMSPKILGYFESESECRQSRRGETKVQ